MDAYGQLWTSGGAAGVEEQNSKLLTDNHLRIDAAEIRTPSCTPALLLLRISRSPFRTLPNRLAKGSGRPQPAELRPFLVPAGHERRL